MATKRPGYTWENGYQQLAQSKTPGGTAGDDVPTDDETAYVAPPSIDLVTSSAHNQLGINVIRSWPSMYDGTNSPHGTPAWWQPQQEVDVLIVGGRANWTVPRICQAGLPFSQLGLADWGLRQAWCDREFRFALSVSYSRLSFFLTVF